MKDCDAIQFQILLQVSPEAAAAANLFDRIAVNWRNWTFLLTLNDDRNCQHLLLCLPNESPQDINIAALSLFVHK